ncbi:MAG TPA: hypothetical protein VMS98_07185 [Thermoanaerobaculia bacterium]|nr:hypothetical protein [Thermoanaerobaculia bacterium]
MSLKAGTYVWFVRASADGCRSIDSTQAKFAANLICGTGEPSNVAPQPDQQFTDVTSITYAWNGAKGATGYDVLLSSDGGRSFGVEVSTTGEASTKVSAPAKGGKFVWFVRANFGPDCKPTISTQSVFSVVTSSTCPTAAPLQIQPANNATNVSTTVVFEWTAVTGASQYTVIATMNGETTALATTTGTIIKVPVTPGKISWKVRAEFLTRCPATESTSSFTFDTEQPVICSLSPAKTRLVAPANGASGVVSPVTFEWGAVSGATGYNLFALVDTGSLLESSKPQLLGSTPDTKFSAPVPEGTITWYVETLFGKCPSSISESFTFKSASATRCDNPATTLSAPVGNASVSSPVTFSWTPMKGAVNYQLFVAFNGSTTFSKVTDTQESSFSQRITPGTHSWFVATEYFGCRAIPSATATFTVVDTNCVTGTVTLRSPATTSTVTSPVTFDWSTLSGVEAYLFTVAVNGVTVVNEKVAAPPQTREISSGSVSWSITPLSGTCRIPPSSGTFTVQARDTCATNVAAAPQSPAGSRFEVSGTAASVDFRWNPAPNAIGYTVEVALPRQAFGEIGATKGNAATTLTRDLKPGIYSWRVVALFAGCTAIPSDPLTFEIVDVGERCSAATPALIFPAAGAQDVTSPTTFLWSSVPGAIAYRVYLNGGVLTNPDLDASRTSFTATLSPGPATWSVEAVFKSCSANRATDVGFSLQQATVCPSDKPELVFPGRDADNVSQLVDFSWKPISGASVYTLFTKGENGTATRAAETSLTSARAKMPSGERIEWYVIASVPGCTAVESDHSFFTTSADCSDRGPILQSPLSDSRDLGSPVSFSWTPVPNALEYNLWIGDRNDSTSIRLVTTTRATSASIALDAGAYVWFVESAVDKCPSVPSAVAFFTVAAAQGSDCNTPDQPSARAVGQVLSETAYIYRWSPVLNAQSYEVQESSTPDFASPATFPVNETEMKFVHVVSSPTTFYYRVRAISSCNDDRSQFSPVVEVDIVTKNTIDKKTLGTAEIGVEQVVIQTLFIPGSDPPVTFSATVDRPWMTVVPSSGLVPLEGITLNVTADPAFLGIGSNVGTVLISYGGAGKLGQVTNSGPTNVPVNVSLVTPVVPGGKGSPGPDSLIIPAVGHAQGANNSLFQSDVRVVNTSTQTMKYQLLFTPSRSDGTVTGRSTTIQIAPGGIAALDDILTSFFGTAASETATGALEIRPLTSSATSTSSRATGPTLASPTIASSRTYNLTANGTLGQFIPAIPFASFIGKNSDGTRALLSLQQIAESNAYRTNFGLVEGSGQPASGLLSVFDSANALVAEIPFNLLAGEHRQLDRLLAVNNISLEEGRIEVEVTSATGKVTAYASTIDNRTNDPLLVTPVLKSAITGTRYIVPGVAFIDGPARWRSDVRIFNAANTEQAATVTFFPQGNVAGAQSQEVMLKPGEVLALDNILVTMFGATSTIGGSLLVSTPQTSSLVATARTYAVTDAGTYGQFVPAVSANESTAMGGRALNILQVEQSINMRTNIGLVETTGRSAMAEVSLILPDSKFTPKVQIPLEANGFTQFNLASFNVGNAVYNARVSVKVISGSGRVAAYGSVIDNKTLDPTYVPAQ